MVRTTPKQTERRTKVTGRSEAEKQMVVLNEVCKAGGRITLLLVTGTGLFKPKGPGSLLSDPYGPERCILLGVRVFGPRSRFTITPKRSIISVLDGLHSNQIFNP